MGFDLRGLWTDCETGLDLRKSLLGFVSFEGNPGHFLSATMKHLLTYVFSMHNRS